MTLYNATSYCPRCDTPFSGGSTESVEKAKKAANNMVREHLQRAIGADMDDGLHDHALELWDSTNN